MNTETLRRIKSAMSRALTLAIQESVSEEVYQEMVLVNKEALTNHALSLRGQSMNTSDTLTEIMKQANDIQRAFLSSDQEDFTDEQDSVYYCLVNAINTHELEEMVSLDDDGLFVILENGTTLATIKP